MKEYRTLWVSQWISEEAGSPQELPNVDNVANTWASTGWKLVHMVPGTNAETYGGLFVTFERDRS
ncbi:hypothetical protein [Kribbella endophytica]